MPKLKARQPTDATKIWSLIVMLWKMDGSSVQDLAKRIGYSQETVYRDMKSPGKMPVDRMIQYFRVLGIPFSKIVCAIMDKIVEKMAA